MSHHSQVVKFLASRYQLRVSPTFSHFPLPTAPALYPMAPTKMTPRKATGGKHADIDGQEFCVLCQDGGKLYNCDLCTHAICNMCINVPNKHCEEVLGADVQFMCGFTHGGKPVLPSFLKVNGRFKLGMTGWILLPTVLILDFHLMDLKAKAHLAMIHAVLQDYLPASRLHTVSVPVSLGKDDEVAQWPIEARRYLKTLLRTYDHTVIVLTDYMDTDTGDMFLGHDKNGKGHSAKLDQFLEVLWAPFKRWLNGAIMYFALCGSLVNKPETLHALTFDAPRLQLTSIAEFLTRLMKRTAIHGVEFTMALKDILPDMSELGHHSAIIHFIDGKVLRYVWAHKIIQPWGQSIYMQCKACGVLQEWLPVVVEGNYVYGCQNKKCGYNGEDRKVEWHSFVVHRPHDCQVLYNKQQCPTAWLNLVDYAAHEASTALSVLCQKSHGHTSRTAKWHISFSRIFTSDHNLLESLLFAMSHCRVRGDATSHAQILKDCKDEIVGSPLREDAAVELPSGICLAIRKLFLSYLDDDDQTEEQAAIAALPSKDALTPEDHEAGTCPLDAGDYWTQWNSFCAAQRLFADKVAKVNGDAQDKLNKKMLGARTVALQEAEDAAAKWNKLGCPKKEKQNINILRIGRLSLAKAIQRTMGVHSVMLLTYELNGEEKTAIIKTDPPTGRDKHFTVSSNDFKSWAKQGVELLHNYLHNEVHFFATNEEPTEEAASDEEESVEITVDAAGNPRLPKVHVTDLKTRQDLSREVFTKAYMKITNIPKGFNISDPSKLTKQMLDELWTHWRAREEKKLPIIEFIKARAKDMDALRRAAYTKIDDNSEGEAELIKANGKGNTEDDKGEGTSESLPKPLSKQPRLSGQPDVPEEGSPAASEKNRPKFLAGLSQDASYKALVDTLMALPIFAPRPSSSPPPASKGNLPIWVSWHWGRKYLPEEIHMKQDGFCAELSTLRRYTFVDCNKGMQVVLGLGLLLRECWRAVEVEADDASTPGFLRASVLGVEMTKEVIATMEEVSVHLVRVVAERDREEIIEGGHEDEQRMRGREEGGEGIMVKAVKKREKIRAEEERKGEEQKQQERIEAEEAGKKEKEKKKKKKKKKKKAEGQKEEKTIHWQIRKKNIIGYRPALCPRPPHRNNGTSCQYSIYISHAMDQQYQPVDEQITWSASIAMSTYIHVHLKPGKWYRPVLYPRSPGDGQMVPAGQSQHHLVGWYYIHVHLEMGKWYRPDHLEMGKWYRPANGTSRSAQILPGQLDFLRSDIKNIEEFFGRFGVKHLELRRCQCFEFVTKGRLDNDERGSLQDHDRDMFQRWIAEVGGSAEELTRGGAEETGNTKQNEEGMIGLVGEEEDGGSMESGESEAEGSEERLEQRGPRGHRLEDQEVKKPHGAGMKEGSQGGSMGKAEKQDTTSTKIVSPSSTRAIGPPFAPRARHG
ncbi:hypothetical protein OG21DRAFT_1567584 [Imleria badia]|nr:hypothetical protein OG21DRAFT_1567584 [Imleria badia]